MTNEEYRQSIAAIGLNQSSAARLFGVDPRTSRRWALGELPVPRMAVLCLRLMLTHSVTADEAAKFVQPDESKIQP